MYIIVYVMSYIDFVLKCDELSYKITSLISRTLFGYGRGIPLTPNITPNCNALAKSIISYRWAS